MEITRGDTTRISFNIKRKDGSDYKMKTGDKLYFTMKKDCRLDACCLQKTFDKGGITYNANAEKKYTINLEPEDTSTLNFGDYDYDIELIWNNNGKCDTKTLRVDVITISKEVTSTSNEG